MSKFLRNFSILLLLPLLLGATVWVGQQVDPWEIKRATQLLNSIGDAGTDPSSQVLAQVFLAVVGDPDNYIQPTAPAVKWEQTNIPADLCEAKKCEAVGAIICEKKPGLGSKGSTIVAGYCLTLCAKKPVKDEDQLFWVAIECP